MHIYTKRGDKGETSILGGKSISKDHPRIEAIGSVDELNAILGLVESSLDDHRIKLLLENAQRLLFFIGAELAGGNGISGNKIGNSGNGIPKVTMADVKELENEIDSMEASLPKLSHFIIPGGTKSASLLHVARTICRRAERRVVAFSKKHRIRPELIVYLNRLGDLLFILARIENRKKRVSEKVWLPRQKHIL